MKKVLQSIIIFWGIVALFPLLYAVREFFLYGEGSYWLFGARDGYIKVTTWLDENADGKYDLYEKPLANICVWIGYQPKDGLRDVDAHCKETYFTTDGQGKLYEFMAGGTCKDRLVFSTAPEGLQPTTKLVSDGCDAKFGFTSDKVRISQRILSIEQFVRRKNILLWITRIILGLFIIAVGIVGTIWLQKNPNGELT